MSDTPETDKIISVGLENADRECVPAEFARKLERERDAAMEHWEEVKEYGTDEINAAVELRQKLAQALIERDEAREDAAHWKSEWEIVEARLCGWKHPRDNAIIFEHEIIPKLERERDEARNKMADALQEVDLRTLDFERMKKERDEAREALMKIEDLFIDGTDIYADRENMGLIARAALEGTK